MSWRFLCPRISFSQTPKTTLQYEWSIDKQGNIKELEEKVMDESFAVKGHYDARKNATRIKRENIEENDRKELLLGLRVFKIITSLGKIDIDY